MLHVKAYEIGELKIETVGLKGCVAPLAGDDRIDAAGGVVAVEPGLPQMLARHARHSTPATREVQ